MAVRQLSAFVCTILLWHASVTAAQSGPRSLTQATAEFPSITQIGIWPDRWDDSDGLVYSDKTAGTDEWRSLCIRDGSSVPLLGPRKCNASPMLFTHTDFAFGPVVDAHQKECKICRFDAWYLDFASDTSIAVRQSSSLFIVNRRTGRVLAREHIQPHTWSAQDAEHGVAGPRFSGNYSNVAFVRGFNIYVRTVGSGGAYRVTADGHEMRRHGLSDWIYTEEFGQGEGLWWSPNARYLAFVTLDESRVRRVNVTRRFEKGELDSYRYALPGEPIARPSLSVVNLRTHHVARLWSAPAQDGYILAPTWTGAHGEIAFEWLTRDQRSISLISINASTGRVRQLAHESDRSYLEARIRPVFFGKGRFFLWPSERSGVMALYLYDRQNDSYRLVSGTSRSPVTSIDGVDETGWVYFTAATNDGLERQSFRTSITGGEPTKLTLEKGTHRVVLSPSRHFFLDYWSSKEQPLTVSVRAVDGNWFRLLGVTDIHQSRPSRAATTVLETVIAADGYTRLNAQVLFPADFDTARRYPLVLYVYGGPHAQLVRDQYGTDAAMERLTQSGFVVLVADNRGTANRDRAFGRATYLGLGQVDLADQIAAVQQVLRQYPQLDKTRVGVYGGSFGGYLSILALTHAPCLFAAGVSMFPVTDWALYDAAYSERYLKQPKDAPLAYQKGSALTSINRLSGHLLLMFGSADPNVHVIHSLAAIRVAAQNRKAIDVVEFPDMAHGTTPAAMDSVITTGINYLRGHLLPSGIAVELKQGTDGSRGAPAFGMACDGTAGSNTEPSAFQAMDLLGKVSNIDRQRALGHAPYIQVTQ